MTKPAGETHDETRPFAKLNGDDLYQLPDGTPHRITDAVLPSNGHEIFAGVVAAGVYGAAVHDSRRYIQEVQLIQAAIGVPQIGAIDEDTRIACREIAGYRWDDVSIVFSRMWTAAHHLARECRENGQTLGAEIASHLHDEIVNGIRELKREEPLDVPAPRPTIEKADKPSASPLKPIDLSREEMVDVGAALLAVEVARMRTALEWIVANKGAHVENVASVAKQGLGLSLADQDNPPSAPVIVERWSIEDALHYITSDAPERMHPIGLVNYLKEKIVG